MKICPTCNKDADNGFKEVVYVYCVPNCLPVWARLQKKSEYKNELLKNVVRTSNKSTPRSDKEMFTL